MTPLSLSCSPRGGHRHAGVAVLWPHRDCPWLCGLLRRRRNQEKWEEEGKLVWEPNTSPQAHLTALSSPLSQDYLIALSLQQQQQPQGLSDLELAQQLQQEEYQQQQAVQPVPARAPSPQVSCRPLSLAPVLGTCGSSKLPPPQGPSPASPAQRLAIALPAIASSRCAWGGGGVPSPLWPSPLGPFLSPSPPPQPLPMLASFHLEPLSAGSSQADG